MKNDFFNTGYEIIDFHTHPFPDTEYNISNYSKRFTSDPEQIKRDFAAVGLTKICGSVISNYDKEACTASFAGVRTLNDKALALRETFGDFYVPGFHIQPDFPEESIEEIRRMASLGVRLIGELVPYHHGWTRYDREELHPILEEAERHSMIVNFHDMAQDSIDAMVSAHPNLTFIAAHPGEYPLVLRHVERMKKYENVYLDISGTGIFRWQVLRHLVSEVGSERILFGSDYPVCNPGVYIGGVLSEDISDADRENIFSKNAKRLLGLK